MKYSLREISYSACELMKKISPYDTGNLRHHGIVWRAIGNGRYAVDIGGAPAPYAVYTNEAWVSPRWRGRQNPNEHWIDNGVQMIVNDIISRYGGRLVSSTGEADRRANKSYWDKKLLEMALERTQFDNLVMDG